MEVAEELCGRWVIGWWGCQAVWWVCGGWVIRMGGGGGVIKSGWGKAPTGGLAWPPPILNEWMAAVAHIAAPHTHFALLTDNSRKEGRTGQDRP